MLTHTYYVKNYAGIIYPYTLRFTELHKAWKSSYKHNNNNDVDIIISHCFEFLILKHNLSSQYRDQLSRSFSLPPKVNLSFGKDVKLYHQEIKY